MEKIHPKSALYVKLGLGGEYEKGCLTSPGTVRVGWNVISHEMCISQRWEEVKQILLEKYFPGHPSTATNQMRQLRHFYESGSDILWITFYQDHLYWCFTDEPVTKLDDGSQIRHTIEGWNKHDIKGKPLDVSRLSGSLLALQGFRATICNVREFEYLVRKINCETSPSEQKAIEARKALIQSLIGVIQNLNWKEFELLTDLIFRQAGWQRLGVLGKTQKDIDLDLLSPIDQERYKIQVKSTAGMVEFKKFIDLAAENQGFASYYFVVHKPDNNLLEEAENPLVKLWLPADIARLVVNYGLVDWLISKAK